MRSSETGWLVVIRFIVDYFLLLAFGLFECSSLFPDRFKRSGIPVIRP